MSLLVAAVGFGGPKVTLSGGTNNATSIAPADADASFQINSDGNMYERDNGGAFVQISTDTDWVRPTSAASLYEWRFTNATGDTAALASSTPEDTWTTSTLTVTVTDTVTGGALSVTFDFEVGIAGTSTAIYSGTYTLTANKDT